MMSTVLVTGGTGYIGSHSTLSLLEAGFNVVVLDNLSNSSSESLNRVARLAGKAPVFVEGDVRDQVLLDKLLAEHSIDAVMHFAGLKAVGESVRTVALLQQQCVRQPGAAASHGACGRVQLSIQLVSYGVWRASANAHL